MLLTGRTLVDDGTVCVFKIMVHHWNSIIPLYNSYPVLKVISYCRSFTTSWV